VSPSEFGYLALGIALGATAGVAILAMVRPRSPLRPVVKVTVTPHALMPRELAVLGGRAARFDAPVPGSPDDDARGDPPISERVDASVAARAMDPASADGRTRVPSPPSGIPSGAVGIPIVGDSRAGDGTVATAAVAVADDPAAVTGRSVLAVRARPPLPDLRPSLSPDPVGIPVVAGRAPAGGSPKATTGRAAASDACADERSKAATACAAADTARDAARGMADRLREAQRAHADLEARVEEAGALADPRRLAAEKERLHAKFKASHGLAASTDEAEGAAREWLTAVSAANDAARDAARRVQSGTSELRSRAAALDKLDQEANAARIAAERAEESCRAAREALATCEERQRAATPVSVPEDSPLDEHWPGDAEPSLERQPASEPPTERLPRILLVLRGDRGAREALVATLARGEGADRTVWHVRLASFVDAVTARAIEDGFIDMDPENAFWRLFSVDEQHEIVEALSALGFRFDGMRGFADDRVPSARDLSLAVGYAGLDRMRIRSWPGEAALAELFDGASVRADMWLATQADDLSLARLEAALGPRAAALTELWDAWGQVRPAMLEER
jgi:hypothetical protein